MYMKTQELLDSLQQIHRILDREMDELNTPKRDNHKSWDAHIITLSMASIGFVFVSLPVGTGCYPWVAYVSLFCFVSVIISALLGFLSASNVYDVAIHDHIIRRKLAQEATNYHKEYCKGKDSLDDREEHIYIETVNKIFEKRDAKTASNKMDSINRWIKYFNHSKTYFFIMGIIMVSVFALINADKLGAALNN